MMKNFYSFLMLLLFSNVFGQINYQWHVPLGTTGSEKGNATVVDNAGNVYTTGYFQGTMDADPTVGVSNLTYTPSGVDFYILKYNATGALVWAKKIGGSDQDVATDMAIDSNGNIYLVGYFAYVVDFNPGTGVNNMGFSGGFTPQGFLLKLDSDGNYLWSKQFSVGATNGNQSIPTTVTVDVSNNVILGGYFVSTMVIDSEPIVFTSISGSIDSFVTKYSATGSHVWSKTFGGLGNDSITSITSDISGNIIISGNFNAVCDFDPSGVTQNRGPVGGFDAFISKWTASGNYVWAVNLGGTGNDYGRTTVVDSSGNPFLIGNFEGTVNFMMNEGTLNIAADGSNTDNYMVKYNSNGNFQWTKTFGASNTADFIGAATIDNLDNIYCTGNFIGSVDFNPNVGVSNLTSAGSSDVFVSKINTNGNFMWATRFGGSLAETAYSIYCNNSGKIATAGTYVGNCYFDPLAGPLNPIHNSVSLGGDDAFVQFMEDTSLSSSDFNSRTLECKIFPNPTNSILHISIDSELESVSVFSIQGQKVYETNSNVLDVSTLTSGIYLVRIANVNGAVTTQKIIKN